MIQPSKPMPSSKSRKGSMKRRRKRIEKGRDSGEGSPRYNRHRKGLKAEGRPAGVLQQSPYKRSRLFRFARNSKPSLRKEGAELLTVGFRYRPISTIVSSQEITDPDKPFFHYVVKCSLYKDNELMGEAVGAANSRELQFAYKWVDANSVGKDTK